MAIDPTIEKKFDRCPHFFGHYLKNVITNFLSPTCDQIFLVVKIGDRMFWVMLENSNNNQFVF
jgi:hypothetical protein